MEITARTETVARLARLNSALPAGEQRTWLQSVFFERRNGHCFVGATNSFFAAIEYIGPQEGEDGFVVVNRVALQDVAAEWVKIIDAPALNWCSFEAIRDPEAISTLRGWRDWFPDQIADKPGRAMFVDIDGLAGLVASSPSGRVVFPLMADARRSIVVRDVTTPDWVGVFFARPNNGLFIEGATLPEWIA